MLLTSLFLAITGSTLLTFLIWIIVAAVIWYLINWMLSYIGIGEPFIKPIKVVLAIVVIVFIINALLILVDKPFIVI